MASLNKSDSFRDREDGELHGSSESQCYRYRPKSSFIASSLEHTAIDLRS